MAHLPNFLIVGAAKAGTTALYQYLRQHPDIFMPRKIKETFFLSDIDSAAIKGPGSKYIVGSIFNEAQYAALFAEASREHARGEACVAYLYFYERTIPRIKSFLGDECRIIISLRNPIDRALSGYLHHRRDCIEPLNFEEALNCESKREQSGWWWGFQYRQISCYFRQVNAYIDAFGRDNVLITESENLSEHPEETLRSIFDFLGVDREFKVDNSTRFNASGIPRNQLLHQLLDRPNMLRMILRTIVPKNLRHDINRSQLVNQLRSRNLRPTEIPVDVRERLLTYFQDDIIKLEQLLDRDFSTWRNLGGKRNTGST